MTRSGPNSIDQTFAGFERRAITPDVQAGQVGTIFMGQQIFQGQPHRVSILGLRLAKGRQRRWPPDRVGVRCVQTHVYPPDGHGPTDRPFDLFLRHRLQGRKSLLPGTPIKSRSCFRVLGTGSRDAQSFRCSSVT